MSGNNGDLYYLELCGQGVIWRCYLEKYGDKDFVCRRKEVFCIWKFMEMTIRTVLFKNRFRYSLSHFFFMLTV